MRRLVSAFLLLTAFLLAGCSDGGGEEHTHDETFDIAIHGNQYDPTSLTMPADHTLRFENHDPRAHTATQQGGAGLDSGDLTTDESHEFRDMKAGTYTFTCKHHANMRVVVTVN